ncbi:hypothetical protein TNCV_2650501 [Trichonephila clavipes]|nr:hypothetical protein TNCV_2650501 [Trichonephila clavipes]
MNSSPIRLKTSRVGKQCTLNLSRARTSSRWCGVVVRRGVPAQGAQSLTAVKYLPFADSNLGDRNLTLQGGPNVLRYATGRTPKQAIDDGSHNSEPRSSDGGFGRLVVKVSDHGRHVISSILVPAV